MFGLWYRRVASSPRRGEILPALRSGKIHDGPNWVRSRPSTSGVGFSTAARPTRSRSGHAVGIQFIGLVPSYRSSVAGEKVQSLSTIRRPVSPASHMLPRPQFSGGDPRCQQNTLVATTDVVLECLFNHRAARCCSGETYVYVTPAFARRRSGARAPETCMTATGTAAASANAVTAVSRGTDHRRASRRSSSVARIATARAASTSAYGRSRSTITVRVGPSRSTGPPVVVRYPASSPGTATTSSGGTRVQARRDAGSTRAALVTTTAVDRARVMVQNQ